MGVCTKLPKVTPLRQIWSNKSFDVCGSSVVLTLYDGEKKKVRENRHWKVDVVYNTTPLPRRRDPRRQAAAEPAVHHVGYRIMHYTLKQFPISKHFTSQ